MEMENTKSVTDDKVISKTCQKDIFPFVEPFMILCILSFKASKKS